MKNEALHEAATRAIEMLRIAAIVIENCAPDAKHHYDGVDCDGYCVADDCKTAADMLHAVMAREFGNGYFSSNGHSNLSYHGNNEPCGIFCRTDR